MLIRCLFFIIFTISISFDLGACYAQSKSKDLVKIEKEIISEEQKKTHLQKEKKQHTKSLSRLKKDLISQAERLQKREQSLIEINQQLDALNAKISVGQKKLTENKEQNAFLVLAAHRVINIPPAISIARPQPPIDLARTRILLRSTLPAMYEQAQIIEDTLIQLKGLQEELTEKKQTAAKIHDDLLDKKKTIEADLKKRKNLLKATTEDHQEQKKKITALRKKSKDIQSLIAAMNENKVTLKDTKKSILSQKLSNFRQGKFNAPVSGFIKTDYGDKGDKGKSQGLTFSSTSGALVTAPYDGTVRFAGPFRSYKLIMIIEHNNGYHSLLAGLSEIYVPVGVKISAGEPVGKLKDDQTTQTSLYYELRHKGKPVNPYQSNKITG